MAPPESLQHRVPLIPNQPTNKVEFRANDLNLIKTPEGLALYEKQYQPPNFTIKELRDCIPAHLFERNGYISSMYLLFDISIISLLFYVATFFDSLPQLVQFVAWPTYWYFQGVFMVGLWILAHECGHQAFSNSKLVNDTVGLILHSIVLIPYHSWRISHAKHHASTGHMTQDQVYIPVRRKEYFGSSALTEAVEASPMLAIFELVRKLTLGWPAYLFFNISGQKYSRYTSHFHPSSPIFRPNQANVVLLSDLGLITLLSVVGYFIHLTSFWTVSKYYIIPYLTVNAWLIVITFLQHTDVYIPHYEGETWNFVRGALTTVDRDFGWFLNVAFHHIHDSHIAHHLFSQMPFYNAIKATPYLEKKLGQYYLKDNTPILESLYRASKQCRYVDDEGEILFFRK